jgi:glycosyltransferase involved in cell wall biosynthesis
MGQKKICVVTHTFLPHVGGIERVVYEQSKRLLKRQFDLFVLTSRINTNKQYNYDGIPVQCYDSLSSGFRLGIPYPIPNITSFKTFLEAIKSSSLIHAHGHPYLSSLIAAKIAKRYHKPFLLTQHNTFIEYNSTWDTVERLNDFVVGKQILKEAKKIITVSNATRKYVLSLGADPEKVLMLHNGVDLNRFKPAPKLREETRKKLGIHPHKIVILTVRRLVYKNGIDTLIEAAKIAIKKNSNIIFLAVGTGPDFNEVKAKIDQLGIGKNFKLAGFVSDENLPAYYNAADFFVLPSSSGEGLPLVCLEAFSSGLPLVATDVGGIKEVMIKGYGKLVPPRNPEAMAESIIEFSNAQPSNLRAILRGIVEKRFSWDTNVDKMVKIYEELI